MRIAAWLVARQLTDVKKCVFPVNIVGRAEDREPSIPALSLWISSKCQYSSYLTPVLDEVFSSMLKI